MTVDDWCRTLADRDVYMPVRDPEQLAWSWVRKGRSWQSLRDALGTAQELLARLPITLVDIRTLEPAYVRGDGGRDVTGGQQILADYPHYFGEFYGR